MGGGVYADMIRKGADKNDALIAGWVVATLSAATLKVMAGRVALYGTDPPVTLKWGEEMYVAEERAAAASAKAAAAADHAAGAKVEGMSLQKAMIQKGVQATLEQQIAKEAFTMGTISAISSSFTSDSPLEMACQVYTGFIMGGIFGAMGHISENNETFKALMKRVGQAYRLKMKTVGVGDIVQGFEHGTAIIKGKETRIFVNARGTDGQVASVLDPSTGKTYKLGKEVTLKGDVSVDTGYYEMLPDGRFRLVDGDGKPIPGGLEAYYAPLGSYRVVSGERRATVKPWPKDEAALARAEASGYAGLDAAAAKRSAPFREVWTKMKGMLDTLKIKLEITPETEKALFFTIENMEGNGRIMDYLRSRGFDGDQLMRLLSACGVKKLAAHATLEDVLPELAERDPSLEVCWLPQ
jgi:hypothetical protein